MVHEYKMAWCTHWASQRQILDSWVLNQFQKSAFFWQRRRALDCTFWGNSVELSCGSGLEDVGKVVCGSSELPWAPGHCLLQDFCALGSLQVWSSVNCVQCFAGHQKDGLWLGSRSWTIQWPSFKGRKRPQKWLWYQSPKACGGTLQYSGIFSSNGYDTCQWLLHIIFSLWLNYFKVQFSFGMFKIYSD